MSINQYLSSDIPETLWWSTKQQQPTVEPSPKTLLSPMYRHPQPPSAPHSPTFNFNIIHRENHTEFVQSSEVETPTNNYTKEQEEQPKEPMFEKPLTPSDVGKLNRLVIPKQHAEKYFPLGGGNSNGTDSSVEKGLLLNFEDEIGKSWRFRYSYWNSSQSYVLTKGWSRFVKEKCLDAGDIVMFERHRLDGDRLFIGWRRRVMVVPTSTQDGGHMGFVAHHHHLQGAAGVAMAGGGGNIGGWTRVFYNAQHTYPSHPGGGGGGNGSCIPYQPDCPYAGSNEHNNNGQTTPSVNPKRSVRLFGVNLECQTDDDDPEPVTPSGDVGGSSPISSHGSQPQYISSSNHNFLDMNMCRDVNQMRYQYQQQYHQG